VIESPSLSVILPCYAAAPLAVRSVEVLSTYLATLVPQWEILVVDDGHNDFAAAPLPDLPGVRLLRHPCNLGKGAAVRTGMLAARGQVRVFTDVDLPYDRELIPLMTEYITSRGFHLVMRDRTFPESRYAQATSLSRRALSSLASRLIGSVVTGGFFDTQCGIKAVRGDIADELFQLVRIRRFAFDVELIYLALKHRLDIKRVPVRLRRNLGTSVRPFRDAFQAGIDILAIKAHQLRGRYRSEALERLLAAEAALLRARFDPPA